MTRPRMTEAEKEQRKHQRKAARMNERERDAFGPLFAHLAPTHTAADAKRLHQFRVVEGVERLHVICGPGAKALRAVQLAWIELYARRWCGEQFPAVRAYFERVHRDQLGYGYTFWQGVLTGDRVVFSWKRVDDPTTTTGWRCVEAEAFQLNPPPLTKAQFWELFPYKVPELGPEPDDGGLFEHVMASLARGAR